MLDVRKTGSAGILDTADAVSPLRRALPTRYSELTLGSVSTAPSTGGGPQLLASPTIISQTPRPAVAHMHFGSNPPSPRRGVPIIGPPSAGKAPAEGTVSRLSAVDVSPHFSSAVWDQPRPSVTGAAHTEEEEVVLLNENNAILTRNVAKLKRMVIDLTDELNTLKATTAKGRCTECANPTGEGSADAQLHSAALRQVHQDEMAAMRQVLQQKDDLIARLSQELRDQEESWQQTYKRMSEEKNRAIANLVEELNRGNAR